MTNSKLIIQKISDIRPFGFPCGHCLQKDDLNWRESLMSPDCLYYFEGSTESPRGWLCDVCFKSAAGSDPPRESMQSFFNNLSFIRAHDILRDNGRKT